MPSICASSAHRSGLVKPPVASPSTSAPLENASPAPVMIAHHTSGSSFTRFQHARSSSLSVWFIAFFRSGRLSVMVATRSRTSKRIVWRSAMPRATTRAARAATPHGRRTPSRRRGPGCRRAAPGPGAATTSPSATSVIWSTRWARRLPPSGSAPRRWLAALPAGACGGRGNVACSRHSRSTRRVWRSRGSERCRIGSTVRRSTASAGCTAQPSCSTRRRRSRTRRLVSPSRSTRRAPSRRSASRRAASTSIRAFSCRIRECRARAAPRPSGRCCLPPRG